MKACLLLTAAIVISLSAANASLGEPGDFTTGDADWWSTASIPADWNQALENGAQVWDNVPDKCHNFVHTSSSGFYLQRGTYDYAGGLFSFTVNTAGPPNGHTAYIFFDQDETWHLNINAYPGTGSLDLWSMAAHEFGHALDLQHAALSSLDTMYANYNYGQYYWRTLESHDVEREQGLYPCGGPGTCYGPNGYEAPPARPGPSGLASREAPDVVC